MFGISFSEIILILLISLIVFGPNQLPKIATKIGKVVILVQHFFSKIKQDLYQHSGIHELNQAKQDISYTYRQIKSNIITSPIYNRYNTNTELPQEIKPDLHQDELEFDREHELFDQL